MNGTPIRSVRVDDETWEAAKAVAEEDGVTMSHVLVTFIQGYGERKVRLPRVETVWE